MAYKSFLVFQSLNEPSGTLDTAIKLAKAAQAHLDIIVMGMLQSPPVVIHDVAPAAEWVQHNQETMDKAFAEVKAIEQHMAAEGVSATVTAECDYPGNLEKIAARYALCCDLHLATDRSVKADTISQRAFNGTLFDAGCPVLLVPERHKNPGSISKIAIAWNGRSEASRAVRCAMPMLREADRINIVVIDPDQSDVGQDPGSDLAAHLSRYDIHITVDVLASGGMSIAEKLNQRARDIDADLLVMGGYGHTRFREWLLGGATHDMLHNAEIPVFMAH